MKKPSYLIGIDEAGRGPLAGPVSVGVALVSTDFDWKSLPRVNDSKQLSEVTREEIFRLAKKLKTEEKLDYAVAMVSAKVIDRIGIVPAVTLAMQRALGKIEHNPRRCRMKLDGGLKASAQYKDQETIIKGDSKEKVIGLASIMAKVTRDRYMVRKSTETRYAPYNLAQHKGYGTKAHREAIAANGCSDLHRRSYCKNIQVL